MVRNSLAVAPVCLLLAGCGTPESTTGEQSRTATPDWGQAEGRWHGHGWMEVPPEEERSLAAEQRMEFARLRSLGYLTGSSPAPVNTGVVVYGGQRTSDGLNLYTSGHFPGAVLMDMAGNRLHEWGMGFADAWAAQPGDDPPSSIRGAGYWRRAHLFENGSTLITESDRGKAFEMTPDGTIVWKYLNPMRAGDDLEFIATVFELVRLPEDFPLDWLDEAGGGRR